MIINYNNWNTMRYELLKATIHYLEKVLLVYSIKEKYKILIKEILGKKKISLSISDFLCVINSNKHFISYFIHLKIYGIYVLLLNDSILFNDNYISYSHGNLVDILELINKVKFFIKDKVILQNIDLLLKYFLYSLVMKNTFCMKFIQ